MHNIQHELRQLFSDRGASLSGADLDAWLAGYPYFTLPAVLYLSKHPEDTTRRHALTMFLALNATDPAQMRRLMDSDNDTAPFYPPEPVSQAPETADAIDTFLNIYGNSDPAQEELLTRLIFNPTPDYAQQLAAESDQSLPTEQDAEGDSHESLINRFIISHPQENRPPDDTSRQQTSESAPASEPAPAPRPAPASPAATLSESLAKIYIKQKRYDRAYEIITQLSLNNPKKSVYFTDQLRFIQKLIHNRQLLDNSK